MEKQNISFEDFAIVIADAIENEAYLDKAALVPKIKALASMFKLKLNSTRYKSIDTPTAYQQQLRVIEQYGFQMLFWRKKLRDLIGEESMSDHYNELDKLLIESGFKDK